jgi:hypothetical protein
VTAGAHDGLPFALTLYNSALTKRWTWAGMTTWGWARGVLEARHAAGGPVPPPAALGEPKPTDEAKVRCPCWSAASWRPDADRPECDRGRRKADGVAHVFALTLDYDNGVGPAEALDRWAGYERLVYTSWSHRPDRPKCRIVLPLAEPVPGPVWSGVYRAISADEGKAADATTLDPSRIWFGHAEGHGGPHYARWRPGRLLSLLDLALDVDAKAQARAAVEAEDRARRAAQASAARAAAERHADRGEDAAGRLRRKLFAVDPDLRARVGAHAGGRIVAGPDGGQTVRKALCPACGRPGVWFGVTKGRARCDHVNTCGYGAGEGVRVIEYADAVGFLGV